MDPGGTCYDWRASSSEWNTKTEADCHGWSANSGLSTEEKEHVFGYGSCDHRQYQWPAKQCLDHTWDRHDGT